MSYTKKDQLKKNTRTHRACLKCSTKRLIKFYDKPTTLICKDCKRKSKRLKKQNSTSSLKKKAWKAFSDYIRTRDSLKTTGSTTHCRCITCPKTVEYKGIQAGHFVGGRGGSVLFDEDLVNGQCLRCNVMLNGNYDSYNLVMLKKHGSEKVIEMLERKGKTVHYKASDYKIIREKYKTLVEDL